MPANKLFCHFMLQNQQEEGQVLSLKDPHADKANTSNQRRALLRPMKISKQGTKCQKQNQNKPDK